MSETLIRQYGLLALRGVIAIVFGVLAIAWPAVTLLSLAALFAAFALVGGSVWAFAAIRNRKIDERWWVMLVLGLASIVAGAMAMLYPAMTMLVLVLLCGANALVAGVADIVVAIRMRRVIRSEWLLMLSGLASIVFGLMVLLFPLEAGVVALALVLGLYAILTGVLMLWLAVKLHRWSKSHADRDGVAVDAA